MKYRNLSGHMLVGIAFAFGAMFAGGMFAAAVEILLGWPATVTAGILAVGAILGGATAFTSVDEIPPTREIDPTRLSTETTGEDTRGWRPGEKVDSPWPTYDPFTKDDE